MGMDYMINSCFKQIALIAFHFASHTHVHMHMYSLSSKRRNRIPIIMTMLLCVPFWMGRQLFQPTDHVGERFQIQLWH